MSEKDDELLGPHPRATARGKFDLVGHVRVPVAGMGLIPLEASKNFVLTFEDNSPYKWVEKTTERLGDWRADLTSTYMRWAIAINAVHKAADYYNGEQFHDKMFVVRGMRFRGITPFRTMDGKMASSVHLGIQPMLAAFALIDMYACLEEVILAMFRIYWDSHPGKMLVGPSFRDKRRLYKASRTNSGAKAEWDAYWSHRLDEWQRKKMYDGLDSVFLGYVNIAGLKSPSLFTRTTRETWAQAIKQIAMIRNALVHGVTEVTEKIERTCNQPWLSDFKFKAGTVLTVDLSHLMAVECFCDQLLTALNVCLIEVCGGSLKSQRSRESAGEH